MTCIDCQKLNIGINIDEKHKHCTRCGCPTRWNHKLQNPLENSDKVGWWEEILTGEMHWNRCKDFEKKKTEIKNHVEDTRPVGQSSLPLQNTENSKKTETVGITQDQEILSILRKCGELESAINQVAKEIVKGRNDFDVEKVSDRLTQIYIERKQNERLDKIIILLESKK